MANVALEDVRQIVEDLFMGYISNIRILNTKGWYLEYCSDPSAVYHRWV